MMTIKEYLQQYGEYERFAQRLKTEYETEAEKLGAIQSGVGDGTPRGTQIGKPVEQLAIELADKWFDWKTAEIEALRMRKEIFDLIKTVPGVGRDVLYYRYIVGKSWLEVGKAVGYSKSRAHDIHNKALEFLANRTPSDSKV